MPRSQVYLFSFLLIISLVLLVLNQNVDFVISANLSTFLLFPVRTISGYVHFLNVSQEKIKQLEVKLTTLQVENQMLKDIALRAESPESLLKNNLRMIKANIIGRDPTNFNGFLYIDKGKANGLQVNNPVIIQEKVVGRIRAVAENTALVETLENDGFAISGVDSRTGIYGIVRKNNILKLEYIKNDDDVSQCDSVFTSGLSENFPGGLLIGTVADVRTQNDLFFKEVIITPAIKVNQLFYVYVIH